MSFKCDPDGQVHFLARPHRCSISNEPRFALTDQKSTSLAAVSADIQRLRHGSGSSTETDFIAEDFVDEDEPDALLSDENSTASEDVAASTSTPR